MRWIRARSLGAVLLACAASCSSPTAPTAPPPPAPEGYAGEWAGTTSHGTPVSFSVSGNQVASFTLALYLPPTCSGTETVLGPKEIILRQDNQQGFALGKVGGDFEWGIALYGVFSQDRRSAWGEIQLVHYPGCGTLGLKWSALRR